VSDDAATAESKADKRKVLFELSWRHHAARHLTDCHRNKGMKENLQTRHHITAINKDIQKTNGARDDYHIIDVLESGKVD